MPAYYVQAGSQLQKIDPAGNITTLTLPTDITIDATKRGRFAILNRKVVFVHAGSVSLAIDPYTDAVSTMSMSPPRTQPTLSATGSGALSGIYKVRHTFGIKDLDGVLLVESGFGPESAPSASLSSEQLLIQSLDISPDRSADDPSLTVFRRVYRTLAGGSVYFKDFDTDGNNDTQFVTNTPDTAIELVPAPDDLGTPPGAIPGTALYLIAAWKGRLWSREAPPTSQVDYLRASALGKIYAWPASLIFPIPPVGESEFGITAFAPRRDEFGVFTRNSLHKMVGNDETDFRRITVVEGIGCVAPESVVVIHDVAYFLGTDGVYSWSNEGVKPLTWDDVHPWFTEDTVFNRSLFPFARAKYNPLLHTYELHLAAAGSSDIDRWISYDLRRKKWLGPHKTGAFTPAAVALINDSNDLDVPIIASEDGYLYKMNQSGSTDHTSTAIDFDVTTAWHSGNTPKVLKQFLKFLLHARTEAGGNLTITPTTTKGQFSESAQADITHALTAGISTHRRIGPGRLVQFRFRQNTAGHPVTIFGYELPFFEISER